MSSADVPSLEADSLKWSWALGPKSALHAGRDGFRLLRSTRNWPSVALARFGFTAPKFIVFRNGLRLMYERRLTAIEVFLEEPYKPLDVRGRDVLDIGAYTGDSALYFAIRGARKVYALEPVPRICEMAVKNVQLNLVANVVLRNEAVGGRESVLAFDPLENALLTTAHHDVEGGMPVRVRTLDALVDELNLDDAVLKLDCEGTEYEVFETVGKETLAHFHEMCIELHPVGNRSGGVEAIMNKLSDAGFEHRIVPNSVYGVTWLLYAKRIKKALS